MHAVNLLPSTSLSAAAAARWIVAALSEADALRDLNSELLPQSDAPADFERARRLRSEWGRWAEESQALVDRLRSEPDVDQDHLQALQLRVEHARLIAKGSSEEMKRRLDKAMAGDMKSGEEVRRELGLLPRG